MDKTPRYLQIAGILSDRIAHGDYLLNEIPASRKLAQELGCSHIVVRKAVEKLLEDGLCTHLPNGRIIAYNHRISESGTPKRAASIAMLHPAFNSGYFARCAEQLERNARQHGCLFRAVSFVHWNDPVIIETLDAFDGVFLLGSAEDPDQQILQTLTNGKARLVTIDLDLTGCGIPRIALFDAKCVPMLIEHLADCGYERIDCLNTQPYDVETARRVKAWADCIAKLGVSGSLHNEPVVAYESPTARAYETVNTLCLSPAWTNVALFCTNEAIAYGAIRALTDAKRTVGKEIGVCAIGDSGNARYFCPSISSVELPVAARAITQSIRWMLDTQAVWQGGLVMEPDDIHIFYGESTRKPCQKLF